MWEIVKAVILGVIEGITEWLPVSSTGHLILADEFLSLNMSESHRDVQRRSPAGRDPRGGGAVLAETLAVSERSRGRARRDGRESARRPLLPPRTCG